MIFDIRKKLTESYELRRSNIDEFITMMQTRFNNIDEE